MEQDKEQNAQQGQQQGGKAPHDRPVRVIEDDTSYQEMAAGHIIPNADAPKNENQRGGFGNRDGKEGYGSDTAGNGPSAIGVNDFSDDGIPPKDNMRTEDEGRGS
ncbi:hypothetical protein ACMA1I_13680 [Pontibacter sp. 13R65]|uniref:hypothetical protein n=1 Tax=Pontibacter sp. 13R65 TaxID=3127458 RepID=UPI00301BE533